MTPSADRLARLLAVLSLAACRPAASPSPPSGDPPAPGSEATDEPADALEDPAEPASATVCGEPGTTFEDHAWAPADAPAIASLRLDDPDLVPALAALSAFARAPGHGLPIPLALSLGQWSWQVPLLQATLRDAGFEPAELTFVASDAAAHAWIWRSTCDLDQAVERIERAWSVRTRRTVDAVVGIPAPVGDDLAFPYDVLLLSGERIALVPAGRGSAELSRLGGRGSSGVGLGAAPTAGRRLDQLDAAPIRLVALGLALVDPSAPPAGDARALRVTARGVEDASVPARP